ncbi:MAG TPA: transposase [Anaeromyxobacter sp.]
MASRSNLAPFVKLGRTLRQYREGVLAAIRLRLSNGRMEGLKQQDRRHQVQQRKTIAARAAKEWKP